MIPDPRDLLARAIEAAARAAMLRLAAAMLLLGLLLCVDAALRRRSRP